MQTGKWIEFGELRTSYLGFFLLGSIHVCVVFQLCLIELGKAYYKKYEGNCLSSDVNISKPFLVFFLPEY